MISSRRRFLQAGLTAAVGSVGSGCLSEISRTDRVGTRTPCRSRSQQVAASDVTRVGFTGDVMFGRSVNDAQQEAAPDSVWGSLHSRLDSLAAVFINLECCLSTRGTRTPGRTYYFRADPEWAIPALKTGTVKWVSLANNHILDYGARGLIDTRHHLDTDGISYAGAAPTVSAARQPAIVPIDGVDIGFISLTDQAPTYAASDSSPGTAHLRLDHRDPHSRLVIRNRITEAVERDPDLLVASLHWGPNWIERPSDRYRAFARWLIDHGIDIVHGHSAHIVQGVEIYRGRPILHDTGDFVDDYIVKPSLRNNLSFLFEVALTPDRPLGLRLVPIEIKNFAVQYPDDSAMEWILRRMQLLSEEFRTTFQRDGNSLVLDLPSGCGSR